MEIGETIIWVGGVVKALGDGRVGGFLVPFGSPADLDLDGEFFDVDTDYAVTFPAKSAVYYAHGRDEALGTRVLAQAILTIKNSEMEAGIWAETQLALRDEYEKRIYQMAESGKMGWSSGSASHLVRYENAQKGRRIARWPLGLDASLTPTPANPKAQAYTMKSFRKEILGEDVSRSGQALADHAEEALSSLEALLGRLEAVKALREGNGQLPGLQEAHRQRLSRLKTIADELLLSTATKPLGTQVQEVLARFRRLRLQKE